MGHTAWRKCLRRIDGLPNTTQKIILPVLWDVKPIHVQFHKRFVNKNAKTKNKIIKICHNLTMQGSSSAVSNSVSHISFLYNISRHNVPKSKHSLQVDTPDDVVAVSACINQLLTLRKNVHLGNIPLEEKASGIDLLCTEWFFYVYSHNYTLNVIVQLHVHVPWGQKINLLLLYWIEKLFPNLVAYAWSLAPFGVTTQHMLKATYITTWLSPKLNLMSLFNYK